MFQEHSECWKISSVSIWHSTQPGTARKCGLASSAQTEQKWVDGLGEDNPTDFLIRAVCISLCQRQAPCPLQTRQWFFLKLQVRQQAKGFFFQDAEGETAWVLGEVRFHSILPPSSVLSRKQVMCPIPTSFKKTVEGTMQTRPLEGLQNPFFKMLLRGLCQTFIWKSSSKTLPQGTAPARWQLLRGWLQAAPAQVNFEIPHLEAATGQVAPVAWGIGCFACQFSFASNESLEVSWNHRKFDDLAQEVYLYIQYVFWFHLGMSYGIMIQKASLLIIPGPP